MKGRLALYLNSNIECQFLQEIFRRDKAGWKVLPRHLKYNKVRERSPGRSDHDGLSSRADCGMKLAAVSLDPIPDITSAPAALRDVCKNTLSSQGSVSKQIFPQTCSQLSIARVKTKQPSSTQNPKCLQLFEVNS